MPSFTAGPMDPLDLEEIVPTSATSSTTSNVLQMSGSNDMMHDMMLPRISEGVVRGTGGCHDWLRVGQCW